MGRPGDTSLNAKQHWGSHERMLKGDVKYRFVIDNLR
jgi:hypothetical protein